MTYALAATYVAAVIALLAAALDRVDPLVRRRLQLPHPAPGQAPPWGRATLRRAGQALQHRGRGRAAIRAASREMPNLLDLLAVTVAAGLSPRLALDRSPEMVAGPLADVLEVAAQQVGLGSPWRHALERAAAATGVSDLRRLAVVLDRSDRLGSPIADRLRELAAEVRAERRIAREEAARKAPVRMLFPLVFLILPAFVLAGVVPALLVATRDVI